MTIVIVKVNCGRLSVFCGPVTNQICFLVYVINCCCCIIIHTCNYLVCSSVDAYNTELPQALLLKLIKFINFVTQSLQYTP